MDTTLLVSDVDDTLLGDDEAVTEFAKWYEKAQGWMLLAYASGRFARSIVASILATDLPEPHAIIGGVGTEILRYPGGMPLDDWPTRLASGWSDDQVVATLKSVSRLRLQPAPSQSRFKVSYFIEDARPGELKAIRDLLYESNVSADLIYSSMRDLDVVPRGINKGSAAAFLADSLQVPRERVLVSGNSANDATLFRPPFRGIVVANADDELKALEGPNVYLSRDAYARGVLEGLRHWTKRHQRRIQE